MTILWEHSLFAFAALTVVIAGAAAYMTGRAIARGWRSPWQCIGYMLLLGGADRFFHYALAKGTLLSLHYYLVDTAILCLIALFAFRMIRVWQLATQYPWLYQRTTPLTYRKIVAKTNQ